MEAMACGLPVVAMETGADIIGIAVGNQRPAGQAALATQWSQQLNPFAVRSAV
jgi:hypothetical protein